MASYSPVVLSLDDKASLPKHGPGFVVSVALAGVQDFIAAARSTRDVWNGSFLLSFLMYEMTDAMVTRVAAETGWSREEVCVLPSLGAELFEDARKGSASDVTVASFPNSVLLRVAGPSSVDEVVEAGTRALQKVWDGMVRTCREAMPAKLGTVLDVQWGVQTRLGRVFELYATSLPVPSSPRGYWTLFDAAPWKSHGYFPVLFEAAGRKFGSRKLVRTFEQVAEEGDRCSLCGARAALAPYARSNSRSHRRRNHVVDVQFTTLREYWNDVGTTPGLRFQFREGERLCAVCVTRRLAPRLVLEPLIKARFPSASFTPRFPSTRTIAVAQDLMDLNAVALQSESVTGNLQAFGKAVDESGLGSADTGLVPALRDSRIPEIDGSWFYPGAFSPDRLTREYGPIPQSTTSSLKRARELRDELGLNPSTHYAAVAIDGDHVGDWLSGASSRAELAKRSGQLLSRVALLRKALEQDIPGRVVYAGGDDALAFVPASRCLDAIAAAHAIAARPECGAGRVSVACVLAKVNDPLTQVLRLSRQLLKDTAKTEYGRDAFVVYRTTAGFAVGGPQPILRPAQMVLGHLRERVRKGSGLSDTVLTSLLSCADGLGGNSPVPTELHKAREKVVRMLADRATSPQPPKAARNTPADHVVELYLTVHKSWEQRPDSPAVDSCRRFLDLLALLRFLSRQ